MADSRERRSRRKLPLGKSLAVAGALVLAGLLVAGVVIERQVTAKWEGRKWNIPSRIYSDAFLLHPGRRLDAGDFEARLERLGYLEQAGGVDEPGATQLSPCTGPSDTNCYVGEKVSFYGLTDLSSRLKYGARLSFDVRAARYVRFVFGTGISWVTAHLLTAAEPCNPSSRDAARSEGYHGMSCGSHPINPSYRASVDAPGRRFWMSGEFMVDRQGMIQFPFLGSVKASEMSAHELERKLTTLLSDGYLKRPQVSVTVKESNSQRVYVTGEVRKPGAYGLRADRSLRGLLADIGELGPDAGHEVVVIRPPKPEEPPIEAPP